MNIVEVLHAGKGLLVCCGQPMTLLEGKTREQGMEKHLPVMEKTDKGVKVKIGSVPHPMEGQHYIEWIAVITRGGVVRKFLKSGDVPEAEFEISEDIFQLRAYCNIHGLWTARE